MFKDGSMKSQRYYLLVWVCFLSIALLFGACATQGSPKDDVTYPEGDIKVTTDGKVIVSEKALPVHLKKFTFDSLIVEMNIKRYQNEVLYADKGLSDWYKNNPIESGLNGFVTVDVDGPKVELSEKELSINSATAYTKDGGSKKIIIIRYIDAEDNLHIRLVELTKVNGNE